MRRQIQLPDTTTDVTRSDEPVPALSRAERRHAAKGRSQDVDRNPAHAPRVLGKAGGPTTAQHSSYTFRRV